ncbi:DUF2087 domain-containing protein [Jannaschia aquimarina]|uniref:DUF2087 domain-containing protein n=1 Tax=Jannaschia aquimarina TaxID=935700 RepID=A0A0D1DBF2_9RHOB|nr:DUF2087 domain-containing protein [Jannaschia aquimarina]KIT17278.1 hypothetical protein jaqu_10090 [Jannaschia aquimarina]SNT19547.1 hypothetical protein SAMN05421775_107135 [Jannaschia aquimarina]
MRTEIPLDVADIGRFAKSLRGQIETDASHQTMLNALARAAGWRNYQHLRAAHEGAAPEPPADLRAVTRAAARFDADGRFTGWPVKRSLRTLCLWPIWARLPQGPLDERGISAAIHDLCTFRDAAGIRREMVGEGLLTRNRDGSDYRRLNRAPDQTQRALIRAVIGRGP